MIGIDLGLNVASVTEVKKGRVTYALVFKFSKEKELSRNQRVTACAQRIEGVILGLTDGNPCNVAIEEPIYSWGRRNPRAFAKSVELFTIVNYLLNIKKYKTLSVNNKTAKKLAGSGSKDKEEMIQAYKKATGKEPGHSTQYGRETLADSYFIALAGVQQLKDNKLKDNN